jgi:3-oxoacyl-[acyl-carrier protein] reductase
MSKNREIMRPRLEGKIALVTGASRGIGKAIALAFGREGADVVVNYVTHNLEAEAVVKSIKEMGREAMAVKADVSDRAEVEAMVALANKTFERIDILVNNAGVLCGHGDIFTLKDEEWDLNMNVNVKGVLNCTRAVAKGMTERHYGSIINIASIAGIGTALLGTTPYAPSKAANIILTKRLAMELGPHGIRVNGIAPGFVKTEMNVVGLSEEQAAFVIKTMQEKNNVKKSSGARRYCESGRLLRLGRIQIRHWSDPYS